MSVSTFCVISLTEEHVCLFVCFSSEMSEWSFISKWYHVISGEITFLNHLPQSDTNKQAPCLCRQL